MFIMTNVYLIFSKILLKYYTFKVGINVHVLNTKICRKLDQIVLKSVRQFFPALKKTIEKIERRVFQRNIPSTPKSVHKNIKK